MCLDRMSSLACAMTGWRDRAVHGSCGGWNSTADELCSGGEEA